jgi:hypothetical protein
LRDAWLLERWRGSTKKDIGSVSMSFGAFRLYGMKVNIEDHRFREQATELKYNSTDAQ